MDGTHHKVTSRAPHPVDVEVPAGALRTVTGALRLLPHLTVACTADEAAAALASGWPVEVTAPPPPPQPAPAPPAPTAGQPKAKQGAAAKAPTTPVDAGNNGPPDVDAPGQDLGAGQAAPGTGGGKGRKRGQG